MTMKGFVDGNVNSTISLILLQINVPQSSTGYVTDILREEVSEAHRLDALNQIEKYAPDLVAQLKEEFGYDEFYTRYGYVLNNNLEDCGLLPPED